MCECEEVGVDKDFVDNSGWRAASSKIDQLLPPVRPPNESRNPTILIDSDASGG